MTLLIIAILPVYLIGLYIYNKDRDKESKKLLTRLFLFGCLSCIPTIILELIIGGMFGPEEDMDLLTLFFYVFISIAIVEEGFKWLFAYKKAYNEQEFDHIYDGIVYCVFVSLGFATIENIFYILDGGITTGIIRAISAIPGHACFAISMGNYLSMAKIAQINHQPQKEKKYLILSVIVPTIIHTLYDYFIFTDTVLFIIVFFLFLIFIYIYSVKKVKKMAQVEKNFIDNELQNIIQNNDIYCPNCHTKALGKYCHKCGQDLSNIKDNNLTQQM